MTLNNASNHYKENSVYTASPEELTLMLYNGAVKFIMLAQSAIDEKDMEKGNNNIIRAQDIILHLQGTLDMKYDVAQDMDIMYDFMYRHLIQANIKKDRHMLQEVLELVKEMRDTWHQAMKLSKQRNTPAQVAK